MHQERTSRTRPAPLHRTAIGLLLLGMTAAGCASGGQRTERSLTLRDEFTIRVRPDAKVFTREFPLSADAVWQAIPAVFRAMNFQGAASTEPGERVFLTPELTVRTRLYEGELNSLYIDCGRTPSGNATADEYNVQFAILMRVVPVTDASSRVEVLLDGRARDRTRSSASAVFCTGTGKLEQEFLRQTSKQLGI